MNRIEQWDEQEMREKMPNGKKERYMLNRK
jgi:hypothetical protein